MIRIQFRTRAAWRLSVAALVSSLGLGACAMESDDEGELEDEVVITPPGDDHPGFLVVQLPQELRNAAPATIDGFPVTVWGQWATYGVPLAVPVGLAALEGRWGNGSSYTTAEIVRDQTTTVTFAAMKFAAPTEAVGGINSLPFSSQGDGLGVGGAGVEYATKAQPRFAGPYRLVWGFHDGVDLQLTANQVKQVNFGDLTNRRAIRIVAPPVREFPDCSSNRDYYWVTASNVSSRRQKLAAGQSVLIGEAAWKRDQGIVYTLWTPGMFESTALRLDMPAQLGQVAEYRLGRLDIDDVAVQTSGGIQKVRGSYRIYQLKMVNGQEVEGENLNVCSTHTGLDVLPGRYRIYVTYQTIEAGQKTTVMNVDVPPGG